VPLLKSQTKAIKFKKVLERKDQNLQPRKPKN